MAICEQLTKYQIEREQWRNERRALQREAAMLRIALEKARQDCYGVDRLGKYCSLCGCSFNSKHGDDCPFSVLRDEEAGDAK